MHIDNLKKVTLSIRATGIVPKPQSIDLQPGSFEFIYGVASSGLCLLESALYEKKINDCIELNINRANAHEMCGHLMAPLLNEMGITTLPDSLNLTITIADVAVAEDREVVQAISQSLSQSGCGGSCDCGCS
ncbi:MAG: hypothetical protein HKP41_19495 [Desulfobacterales bacterium]|nr:hypothetical protein [Deltaproteobacteria bacterium]NNF46944.1 hypothetical protein [Desulfofustis sp.]NNK96537.1 hypothetical protein [Desulfobacterales bacterium]